MNPSVIAKAAQAFSASRAKSPYVGPRAMTDGDSFHGREQETDALLYRLLAERIVMLYSPSGAGKSSLIQAGLVPKLAEHGYIAMPTIRVGLPVETDRNRFVASMISSLESEQPLGIPGVSDMSLLEYVKARIAALDEQARSAHEQATMSAGKDPNKAKRSRAVLPTPVLIFDQFEELITFDRFDVKAKRAYVKELAEVLDQLDVWTLFAIREEYLGEFDPYRDLLPTRLASTFRLGLLEPHQAVRAIEEPAKKWERPFTEAATKALVKELRKRGKNGDGPRSPWVEPLHLQVVCRRIWEQTSGRPIPTRQIEKRHIRQEDNSVDEALAAYYESEVKAADKLDEAIDERAIRDWFGTELIGGDDVRRATPVGPQSAFHRAEDTDDDADEEEDQGRGWGPIVEHLLEAQVIRPLPRPEGDWLELSHDRLVDGVRRSNVNFDSTLREWQQKTKQWAKDGRPRRYLRGGELDSALFAKNVRLDTLTKDEVAYIAESKRARLRRWLTMGIAAIGLVILLAVAIVASRERNEARRAENRALAEQLAGESRASTDPNLALILAMSAERSTGDNEVQISAGSALYQAVVPSRIETAVRINGEYLQSNLLSTIGRDLLAVPMAAPNTLLRIDDPVEGEATTIFDAHAPIEQLATTPASGAVIAAAVDGRVLLWDDGDTREFRHAMTDLRNLAFSSDGKTLALLGADEVVLVDVAAGTLDPTPAREGSGVFALTGGGFGLVLDNGEVLTIGSDGSELPPLGFGYPIDAVATAPGDALAVLHQDQFGAVWMPFGNEYVPTFEFFSPVGASGVTFVNDGSAIAVADRTDGIAVFDLFGNLLFRIEPSTGAIASVTVLGDDRVAVATQGGVAIWNSDPGHRPGEVRALTVVDEKDGLVASTGARYPVLPWHVLSAQPRAVESDVGRWPDFVIDEREDSPTEDAATESAGELLVGTAIASLTDGRQAIAAGQQVYVARGDEVIEDRVHEAVVRAVAAVDDGYMSASEDGHVIMHDGSEMFVLDTAAVEAGVRLVDMSVAVDSQQVATLISDGSVNIWGYGDDRITTMSRAVDADGHALDATAITAGAKGWILGFSDGTAASIDFGSEVEASTRFGEGLSAVLHVAAGPAGYFAIVTADNTAEIWAVDIDLVGSEPSLVARIPSRTPVNDIAFFAREVAAGPRDKSKLMLLAATDGRIVTYPIDVRLLREPASQQLGRLPNSRECERFDIITGPEAAGFGCPE